MCVAGDDVALSQDGGGDGFALGVEDLYVGGGLGVSEACVVELMAAEHVVVEGELPVAEGEASVGLARRDGVGEYAAHGIGIFVGDDLVAEVHHAAAFCDDAASGLGEVANEAPHAFGLHERLKVLLRVAAGEVEDRPTPRPPCKGGSRMQ